MSKLTAGVYIVFADYIYEQKGGAYDSKGAFDSLKGAKTFCETALFDYDDYSGEVETVKKGTVLHLYTDVYIATIKGGELFICSRYNQKTKQWESRSTACSA